MVNPCETTRVTLRQRYEFGIFGFHSTLHNVDQNDHLVDGPMEYSPMFIFQEPLVSAREHVRPDTVFRDLHCLPGFVYNGK